MVAEISVEYDMRFAGHSSREMHCHGGTTSVVCTAVLVVSSGELKIQGGRPLVVDMRQVRKVELTRSRRAACVLKGTGGRFYCCNLAASHTTRNGSRDAGCPSHLPGQTWTIRPQTCRGTYPHFLQFTNGLRVTHSRLFEPQGVLRLLLNR